MGLNEKITLVQAQNYGGAKKFNSDFAEGLENASYYSIGAQVLLTRNICTAAGLCNRSSRIIKEIFFSKIYHC